MIQNERSEGRSLAGKLPWYLSVSAALAAAATLAAEAPPKDLLKQVAAAGTRFEKERERYSFRQTFHFREIDRAGRPAGDYIEVREVDFGPDGERLETFLKGPINRLRRIRMTEEDFRDLREMQPFVITEDSLWLYETRHQGEETVGDRRCHVYRIRPRQVLEGQRLLDGQIWIDQETLQVVQAGGQPLPQHYGTESSNLFARFVTFYEPIDGEFWFPVKTVADDALPFPSGVQRVRYEIVFDRYKRFSADSSVRFGESDEP